MALGQILHSTWKSVSLRNRNFICCLSRASESKFAPDNHGVSCTSANIVVAWSRTIFQERSFISFRGSRLVSRASNVVIAESSLSADDKEIVNSSLEGLMYSAELHSDGDNVDALVESLLCFGAKSCSVDDANLGTETEEEIFSKGPVPWDCGPRQLWQKSRIKALFSAEEDILTCIQLASQSVGMEKTPQYRVTKIADQDWVQQVQDMFEPIQVSDDMWVIPHWCVAPDENALNIKLDPGLAFGTGEHPTTRLCLRFLQKAVNSGDRILDCGCGSGVLAIAALKMGASHAIGVDIDPLAIRSSNHNASLNDINPSTLEIFIAEQGGPDPCPRSFSTGNENSAGDFDVVVANILVNPLIQLVDRIAGHARAGGLVGLSGILINQVEQVKTVYSPYLEEMVITVDEGWAFIQGRRCL